MLNPSGLDRCPRRHMGHRRAVLQRLPLAAAAGRINELRPKLQNGQGRQVQPAVRAEFQNVFNRLFLSAPSLANPNLAVGTTSMPVAFSTIPASARSLLSTAALVLQPRQRPDRYPVYLLIWMRADSVGLHSYTAKPKTPATMSPAFLWNTSRSRAAVWSAPGIQSRAELQLRKSNPSSGALKLRAELKFAPSSDSQTRGHYLGEDLSPRASHACA